MQKLGIGLRGLDTIIAFLGIAPNHGSDHKWNRLMNRIGIAKEVVSEEVMLSNQIEERQLTEEAAAKKLSEWMTNTPEGMTASPQAIVAK